MQSLPVFSDSAVAALAWSCFSPPLLGPLRTADGTTVTLPALDLNEQRLAWLRRLDAQPAPLHAYLDEHCHSPRLGLVHEALWHFFLREDPQTELLTHNLPVRNGGHTLGEFDIIYYCHRRRRHFHLELAVKFYLATPAPELPDKPMSRWLGPDCRDRLDLKVERLLQHQLTLAQTEQGHAALAGAGIGEVFPELRMSGWLFQALRGAVAPPAEVCADHPHGLWMTVSQFRQEYRQHFPQWYALRKPRWLDGVAGATPLDDAVLDAARSRPQMLIATDENGADAQRVFITPDPWPVH